MLLITDCVVVLKLQRFYSHSLGDGENFVRCKNFVMGLYFTFTVMCMLITESLLPCMIVVGTLNKW